LLFLIQLLKATFSKEQQQSLGITYDGLENNLEDHKNRLQGDKTTVNQSMMKCILLWMLFCTMD
jgi:hypothetical protein